MESNPTRLARLVARLKERGFRLTPQRMAVLRILAASEDHPSVETIHERVRADFPMVSLATVYKTVNLLKEMGEVLELAFGDDHRRYDGNRPRPHPHLICVKCHSIADVNFAGLANLPDEIARHSGYQILNHRLDFFGICPACQAQAPRSPDKLHG